MTPTNPTKTTRTVLVTILLLGLMSAFLVPSVSAILLSSSQQTSNNTITATPTPMGDGVDRIYLTESSANQSTSTSKPPTQSQPTSTPKPTQTGGDSHKIEIIHVNGSVSYRLTSAGTINFVQAHAEKTDQISGQTASGDVGGLPWETNSNDSKDVIRFTGEVYDLELNDKDGKVRVTLDGKPIDPNTLRTTPTPAASTARTETPASTATVTSTPSPSPRSPTHTARAPTHTPANEATPTDTGTNLFSLTQIINTVVGLFVLALVGTGVGLYLWW